MNIEYSKEAVRYISRLDYMTKQRLKRAIEKLPKGKIKPMEGSKNPKFRLRVGDYRVLFSIHETAVKEDGNAMIKQTILIEKVGPRGDVYK